MANERAVRPSCPDTGLAVPECSCRRCLERMLREVQPTLLAEHIRITRVVDEEPGAAEHREAA